MSDSDIYAYLQGTTSVTKAENPPAIYTQADLDRARSEAAAEMKARAAGLSQLKSDEWSQEGLREMRDGHRDLALVLSGKSAGSGVCAQAIRKLSPDPDYAARMRREAYQYIIDALQTRFRDVLPNDRLEQQNREWNRHLSEIVQIVSNISKEKVNA